MKTIINFKNTEIEELLKYLFSLNYKMCEKFNVEFRQIMYIF